MSRCHNPTLRTLQKKGYDALSIPRAGLVPGDVLFRRQGAVGRVSSFVSLPRLHQRGVDSLKTKKNRSPEIHSEVRAFDAGSAGIGLAEGWSKELGVTAAVHAALVGAHSIELGFDEIEQEELENPLLVDDIAGDLDVTALKGSAMLSDFVSGRGELFVLFETLSSRSFLVRAYDSKKRAMNLDGTLRDQGGVKLSSKVSGSIVDTVRFEGLTPLCFAVKAWQLYFDTRFDRVKLVPSAPTEKTKFSSDEAEVHTLAPDELVTIADW